MIIHRCTNLYVLCFNNILTFCFFFGKVNPIVATFYDAVLLYAYGLNRTIESNGNWSDGFAVVQKMWNVSFEGLKTEEM